MTTHQHTQSGNFDPNKRTGLFGGTFDPVHNGHLGIANYLTHSGVVDQVIFIPASQPPHKLAREITPGHHRVKILELAIMGARNFFISDYELNKSGISYTIDTARYFSKRLSASFYLVIGIDSLRELYQWREARKLVESYQFLVYPRPHMPVPERSGLASYFGVDNAEKLLCSIVDGGCHDVSSSDIRRRIRNKEAVENMLPKPVHEYILNKGLYGA